VSAGATLSNEDSDQSSPPISLEFELAFGNDPDAQGTLHTLLPPELPDGLSPGQAAQLSEMLQYFHLRMRGLVQSVKTKRKSEQVLLNLRQWQNLLDLSDRVAGYLRSIGEPER